MRRLRRDLGGYLAKETRMLTEGVPMHDNPRPHSAAANMDFLTAFIHSIFFFLRACQIDIQP